jgi:Fe-S-cluster containining protein
MKEAAEVLASYNEKITFHLAEIARIEGLERFGNGRPFPSSALEIFQKVLGLFDSEIVFLLSEMRRGGQTIQCKPHCSHCCHQMPANVSTIELIAIYHQVQQRGLLGRFMRRSIRLEEVWAGVFDRCGDAPEGTEEVDHFREIVLKGFLTLKHPCPFLEDGLCAIYDCRPLSCRMHFSISPPHWCNPSHFQNPHAMSFNLEPAKRVREGLARIDFKLQLGLSEFMVSGLLGLAVNIMRCGRVCLI